MLTFVPVLGAPLAHAPVLRFDLLKPLKRPIDGGRTLNGRRPCPRRRWRRPLHPRSGHFVLAAWPLLAPVHRMTPREVAAVFATVAVVHVPINLVGYAVGARTTAI